MKAERQALQRAAALAAAFAEIERTRMVGVPLLNHRLQVQAVGFEPLREPAAAPGLEGKHGGQAVGGVHGAARVHGSHGAHSARSAHGAHGAHGAQGSHLVPDEPTSALGVLLTPWFMNLVWLPLQRSDTAVRADERRLRRVGEAEIEFTVASDAAVGVFECCSLFSPMFEFADQATAVATAVCALDELRQAAPAAQAPATLLERPARRSFLFGRQGGEQ